MKNLLMTVMLGITFVSVADEKTFDLRTWDSFKDEARAQAKKEFANRTGRGSPDILIIRSNDAGKCCPEYLYYVLKRKAFFDFVMAGNPKGLKMPRGDKNRVMQFEIPALSLAEQEKIVAKIRADEEKIAQLRKMIADCRAEKEKTVEAFLK